MDAPTRVGHPELFKRDTFRQLKTVRSVFLDYSLFESRDFDHNYKNTFCRVAGDFFFESPGVDNLPLDFIHEI